MKKYYAAYGSNLNMAQMAKRCPHAVLIGTARLKHWRLVFKGCLDIEPCYEDELPLGIWEIDEDDEYRLDRYEGYPRFYEKTVLRLPVKFREGGRPRMLDCLIYIMQPGYPERDVTSYYYETCSQGYRDFGFDERTLQRALSRCGRKPV